MDVHATSESGAPINNFTGSLTVGEGGPIVLQDINFLGRMQHALRERIPERFVHAKGAGAKGTFWVTKDITSHCKANLFSVVGKVTECMVRMSTVGGERGSSDNERDARGFAVKFYTQEGIWDLLSLSTPVFFIRDPILFPQLIHCQKKNPRSNLKDPNSFWDFMTQREETVHMLMMIFADRGIPDGYEHMNGYSGNTFTMVNKNGEIVYVRFKWQTQQKVQNITNSNDPKLNDPDYSTKQLFEIIENKNFPKWKLQYQFMTQDQAKMMQYEKIAFDATKIKASTLKRYDTGDSENFTQSKNFYNRTLGSDERARLASNIAESLAGANRNLRKKAVNMFEKVSADLSTAINSELTKNKTPSGGSGTSVSGKPGEKGSMA